MSEYTRLALPDTTAVRWWWAEGRSEGTPRPASEEQFDRWLAAHDADLTERVRAEQRETDAQIAEREVFGWEEYDEACINIAAAIREAGNTDA